MVKRIKEAQSWWEKVQGVQQNIKSLQQQILDLARRKLQEIYNYYEKRQKRAQALVSYAESNRNLKKNKGKQITAQDYNDTLTGLNAELKAQKNREMLI